MILAEMKLKIPCGWKYSGGNRRRSYRNHFLCRFHPVFMLLLTGHSLWLAFVNCFSIAIMDLLRVEPHHLAQKA